MRRRFGNGFTLIELVAVIVVLSIAAAIFATGFAQLPRSLVVDEEAQTAGQLAQECGEHIVAFRRDSDPSRGYDNVPTGTGIAICDGLTALPPGYTRSVDVTDAGGAAPCPSGAACKQAVVTASGSAYSSRITFLLVK